MTSVFIHTFAEYKTLSFTDNEEAIISFTPDTLRNLGINSVLALIKQGLVKHSRTNKYAQCVALIKREFKAEGLDTV